MAVVVACVIVGLRLVAILSGEDEPEARSTPVVTRPSPSPNQTTSGIVDHERILAIIADAHSGRYFPNDFQDQYSKLEEVALLSGMIESSSGDPTMTDEFFACVLSVMETHWPPSVVLVDPDSAEEVGSRAGVACHIYRHLSRDGSVPLPESIGNLSRLDDRRSIIAVENVRSQMVMARVEGDVAFYGWGAPTAVLMWIRVPSAKTVGDVFEDHGVWFASRDGLLETTGKTAEVIAGSKYVCAPVFRRFDRPPGTLCAWRNDDLFWMLLDSSGQRIENSRSMAVEARDAQVSLNGAVRSLAESAYH